MPPDDPINETPPEIRPPLDFFTITQSGSFPEQECINRNLDDKVIMIQSEYCGHCTATLPDFIAACQERNITPSVLDISTKEGRVAMGDFVILIQYTPTFIFGCEYMVGTRPKAGYLELLDGFLEADKNG